MKAFLVSHLLMLMVVPVLLVSFTNKNRFLDSVEVHSHTDVLFCPPFCTLYFVLFSFFFFFFFFFFFEQFQLQGDVTFVSSSNGI